ncbi:hypothetical protein FJW04_17925 [Mesorhizobium sp. B2-7-3]|uniref:hypothetical protein n=1 Tax=Mesorhizobium sp. B2-7-3 TaxID=2589907 RepID=UPI00112A27BE|nr:hypothetical protein [Mesorhizobium sp. B2-7-3]TPJ14366.1 hypothetical protein FJW04_17925 [Mesorhizobium sp. B2-7-3]
MTVVIGLFDNHEDANQAVGELGEAGVALSDISIVAGGANGWYADHRSQAAEDAAAGAAIGGLVGGAAGLLAGFGIMVIPGLGPVVAAGWLAATAAGAIGGGAAAGVTGGIIGAMTSSGVPESDAGVYAEGIRQGGTLVVAKVRNQLVPNAKQILRARSVDLVERRSQYQAAGWTGFDPYAG